MLKKSLCLAAGVLAGSLLSASAQNVYSLNVVGYVNVPLANGYNLVANPLDDGKGNNSSNLVPATLPIGSQVLIYTPGVGYVTSGKKAGGWSPTFTINPGTGYFVRNLGTTVTNTFVGSVAGSVPGSITNTLAVGYNLVGSPYPIGGNITNTGSNSLNLPAGLPIGSQVLTYTPGVGYVTAGKKAGGWSPALSISVGSGFFVRSLAGAPLQWTEDVGP